MTAFAEQIRAVPRRLSCYLLSIVVSTTLATSSARADESQWTQVSTSTAPSARSGASMILDAPNNRLLLFGGAELTDDHSRYYPNVMLNDLWSFSLSSRTWSQLSPGGNAPSARHSHVAVYDPGRTGVSPRMLVFGGITGDMTVYALSLGASPAWSVVTTQGTQPSAIGAAYEPWGVYADHGDQMIVGGFDVQQTRTYALKLATSPPTWTNIDTGTNNAPQVGGSAAYDPVNERVIVLASAYHGSYQYYAVLSLGGSTPTWSTWSPSAMQTPYPNHNGTLSYDPVRKRMLFYGATSWQVGATGCNVNAACGVFYDDREFPSGGIYAFDCTNSNWSTLAPSGTVPTARGHNAAVFVPASDELIVFGGSTHDQHAVTCTPCNISYSWSMFADTWSFRPDVVAPGAVTTLATVGHCYDVGVSWTATGDDGSTGTAAYFELRYSPSAITLANFSNAQLLVQGAPSGSGASMNYTLYQPDACDVNRFAVRSRDEGGLWSGLSNVPTGSAYCGEYCEDLAPVRFHRVSPNPARSDILFRISATSLSTSDGQLSIYDALGRRVRVMVLSSAARGEYQALWDLRDVRGTRVDAGVYFARLRVGDRTHIFPVTVL